MKDLFNYVAVFAILFAITYLLGAFISTSFNIAEWRMDTRVGVAIFGTLISTALSLAYNEMKKHK